MLGLSGKLVPSRISGTDTVLDLFLPGRFGGKERVDIGPAGR